MMLDRVLQRIRKEPSLMRVERDTGLKYSWLRQLVQGKYADPGVQKIEKLDCYFRARDEQESKARLEKGVDNESCAA